jgi:hypothetical protein
MATVNLDAAAYLPLARDRRLKEDTAMTSWYVVLIINGNLYLGDVMYATKAECERELVQAQVLISHAGDCRESPLQTVKQ